MDNIKKKIDEDEKLNKKTGQIKECYCGAGEGQSDFEKDTAMLNSIMTYTKAILSSDSMLHKTELVLIVNEIFQNYLYDYMQRNNKTENDEYDEIVIDGKKAVKRNVPVRPMSKLSRKIINDLIK